MRGNNFMGSTNHGLDLKSRKTLKRAHAKNTAWVQETLHDLTIFFKQNTFADTEEY